MPSRQSHAASTDARVVAAAHDEARSLAVEIRDSREEAVDAVAVAVAPSACISSAVGCEIRRDGGRGCILGRGERRAGQPVEDRQEFGPFNT